MKKEKIVGILGGMGPYATVDFFSKILLFTPAKKDSEHLRILIDNNVKIPSRTRALLYDEQSPVPMMIESINLLADMGADFAVVPCNSAHYFYPDVSPHIRIPWLNQISIVSNAVKKLGASRPLILGGYVTITKKLFTNFLHDAQYLDKNDNSNIVEFIEEIKLNSCLSNSSINKLEKIISKRKEDIDCIIFACTEFSLIDKDKICGFQVIDSTSEYAKEVVYYAKELTINNTNNSLII